MPRWLRVVMISVGGLVGIFVLVGLILPSGYRVERSVFIQAGPEEVHRMVGDLDRWGEWEPWRLEDPTIVTTVETSTGVGAHQHWVGESGNGELTFTTCDPATGIVYDLSFDEGRYLGVGSMLYSPTPEGTEVRWIMEGDNGWNIVGRYFGAMMGSMVGPSFETGLDNLKTAVETNVAQGW